MVGSALSVSPAKAIPRWDKRALRLSARQLILPWSDISEKKKMPAVALTIYHWAGSRAGWPRPCSLPKPGWTSLFWKNSRTSAAARPPSRATGSILTWAPPFLFIRKSWREIFCEVGRDLFKEVRSPSWTRSIASFWRGRRVQRHPELDRTVAEISRLSPADAQISAASWPTTGLNWPSSRLVSELRFPAGKASLVRGCSHCFPC